MKTFPSLVRSKPRTAMLCLGALPESTIAIGFTKCRSMRDLHSHVKGLTATVEARRHALEFMMLSLLALLSKRTCTAESSGTPDESKLSGTPDNAVELATLSSCAGTPAKFKVRCTCHSFKSQSLPAFTANRVAGTWLCKRN